MTKLRNDPNYLWEMGVTPVLRIEPDPDYQGPELLVEKVHRDPKERKQKNFRAGNRNHRNHRCHDNCKKCLPKHHKKISRGSRAYQSMMEE